MKTAQRTEARVLRRRGYSLGALSHRLDISKSTASLWTKGVALSPVGLSRVERTREENMLKAGEVLHAKKIERIAISHKAATDEFGMLERTRHLDLSILAMIYQCEGSKSDRCVRFTNSDPDLVRMFLTTFRSAFTIDEERLRIRIHVHDYHDDGEMKTFWSSVTGIPLSGFYESFQKASEHRYKKEGYKGCVHISYCDAHISQVIHEFAKKLFKLYI